MLHILVRVLGKPVCFVYSEISYKNPVLVWLNFAYHIIRKLSFCYLIFYQTKKYADVIIPRGADNLGKVLFIINTGIAFMLIRLGKHSLGVLWRSSVESVSLPLWFCSGHQLDSPAHPRHYERRTKQAPQRLHERPQHSTAAADIRVQQPTSLTSSHLSSQSGEGCGGLAL